MQFGVLQPIHRVSNISPEIHARVIRTDQLALEAAFYPIHTLCEPFENGSMRGEILNGRLRRMGRISIKHSLG